MLPRGGDVGSRLAAWLERAPDLGELRPPVVVACSGGPDSLALLALASAAELRPRAVHVDHGLRADSARDAAVVAELAAHLGAEVASVRVHVAPGANLEARARRARYEVLEGAARSSGATALLVGHTMDDQAETVLLNLLRGSAGSGLAGMASRNGRVVRPLLGLRRADTEAICAVLGVEPVRDPMNADPTFRRVWVREEVLPTLAAGARRDLVPVLARQAELLRDESDLLDDMARAGWPSEVARASELAALPVALARRAVRCWVGAPPPRRDEVEAVLAVARGERRGVQLAGGRHVWRRRGVMHHGLSRDGRGYGVGA